MVLRHRWMVKYLDRHGYFPRKIIYSHSFQVPKNKPGEWIHSQAAVSSYFKSSQCFIFNPESHSEFKSISVGKSIFHRSFQYNIL